jgi:hypothetical protein
MRDLPNDGREPNGSLQEKPKILHESSAISGQPRRDLRGLICSIFGPKDTWISSGLAEPPLGLRALLHRGQIGFVPSLFLEVSYDRSANPPD